MMPLRICIQATTKDQVERLQGKTKYRLDNIFSCNPLSMKLYELSAKLTNKYKTECLTKLSRTSLASPAGEVKCTYLYV